MKILVTGGNGQLGKSLQKIAPEYPDHEFFFCDLPEGDITDRDRMAGLINETGAEIIVNCAAYTAVDKAEEEPEAARSVNTYGPEVLASLAGEYGIKIVHISTDYIFDGVSARPYREDDAANPRTVYGRTKLEGEIALRMSGVDAAIIRTSWLYSEYGANFVKTMLRLAGDGRDIRVVDDQTGCPTYATDLARAIVAVIEEGEEGIKIYHYSNEGSTTWLGFAREIFHQAGQKPLLDGISTAEYNAKAHRPAYSVLDTSAIKSIGVEIRNWKEALAECLSELGV